ncbi:methyltransferase [Actinomycetota bacterium]|nr:methyltransferase [Actinomycetota bacterium]
MTEHPHHTHADSPAARPDDETTEQFWEGFYQANPQVWSGRVNPLLAREAADLAPGTALDLGCGEGGDAIWLAGRGWRVTGVDISATALARAEEHAAAAGLAGRIDWQRHDLAESFPAGTFDLVSLQFVLHRTVELPRARVLLPAAAAVAPGGVLLVVGHAGFPSFVTTWETDDRPRHAAEFPTPDELLTDLDLTPGEWDVEVAETVDREVTGPEGQVGTRGDHVLRVRRSR